MEFLLLTHAASGFPSIQVSRASEERNTQDTGPAFAPLRTSSMFNTDSSCVVKTPFVGCVVFFCSHPFHDQGCFSCSYLEGQVHTSDPFLVLSKYSFILCPNKVRKDKPSHAVPSLGSEVRALAGPGVSSFRILGGSDTRPLCLQAPGHTYKILQVVPLQAPSLGLMWGDNLTVHWQHSPEPSSTASLSPP